jgi:hypothetical protein
MDPVISRELFADQVEEVRQSELLSILGWEVVRAEYPELIITMAHPTGRSRNFLLDCSRFDELPPYTKLVDSSGTPILDAEALPQGGPHFFRYQTQTSPYPSMCYEFTAEYYEWWHTGSLDGWHSRRDKPEYRLLGILTQLYQVYRQTNG